MSQGELLAVVGGALGSEGKGVIVNHLAGRYDVHVRVGAPNAGHSFYHQGRLWKMQSLPCGWTNPDAWLVIGAGGVVAPDLLMSEINAVREVMPEIDDRVVIDGQASVLSEREHKEEGGVNGEMHRRIGSTGEGVGAARIGRIRRDPTQFSLAHDLVGKHEIGRYVRHRTAGWITGLLHAGRNVLLEGTQGSGLSLIHGPWPFTTSNDCNAAQMLADVGLSPFLLTRLLLVCRSYPIRVAGNSGPLYKELTWEEMSRRLGKPVEEKTTVTKKIRRIGEWDPELFRKSVQLNLPTDLVLTFADYLNPADEGKTSWGELSDTTLRFIKEQMENPATLICDRSCPVAFVGTGGEGWKVVERSGAPFPN